jgi:hypothetical protein
VVLHAEKYQVSGSVVRVVRPQLQKVRRLLPTAATTMPMATLPRWTVDSQATQCSCSCSVRDCESDDMSLLLKRSQSAIFSVAHKLGTAKFVVSHGARLGSVSIRRSKLLTFRRFTILVALSPMWRSKSRLSTYL